MPQGHTIRGHWTIDACRTSQFEQFIRAVAGLPLGDPSRHSDAVMTNLLGDDASSWRDILDEGDAKLHLYGKTRALPGRKMGHVTRLYSTSVNRQVTSQETQGGVASGPHCQKPHSLSRAGSRQGSTSASQR